MTTFYYACEFLYTAVRIWASFYLVEMIAAPRGSVAARRILQIVVGAMLGGVHVYNSILTKTLFSNNLLFFIVVVLFIATIFMHRKYLRERMFTIAGVWLILAYADFFVLTCSWYILYMADIRSDLLITVGVARGIYLLMLSCAILYLMVYLKKKLWKKKEEYITALSRYKISLVIVTIFSIVGIFHFQRVYILLVTEQYILSWVMFVLLTLGVGVLFCEFNSRWKYREQSALQAQKIQLLEENYERQQRIQDEKRLILHDMKNHMGTIREMAASNKQQELLEYIDTIYHGLGKHSTAIVTGHQMLDLVINLKVSEAEEKGIKVLVESDGLEEFKMRAVDISTIFSNLFDNAIEANERGENLQKKWIHLTLKRQGAMLILVMINPCEKVMYSKEGQLVSLKRDWQIHGNGLRSIKKALCRYDGQVEADIEGKIFVTKILLPGIF